MNETYNQLRRDMVDRIENRRTVQEYWREFADTNGISQVTGEPVTPSEIGKNDKGPEATRARLAQSMGEYGAAVTVDLSDHELN